MARFERGVKGVGVPTGIGVGVRHDAVHTVDMREIMRCEGVSKSFRGFPI